MIVLYNFQNANIRENAIEILKMRYGKHEKKIVTMEITEKGVTVHPDKNINIR
ncbi:MAG: hypothetical protein JSV67_00215 [Thermoplasmatales archaeon]|nr:MAG: hypothetical protein JSV67_00215 [Thermoplasmatales archaeon]